MRTLKTRRSNAPAPVRVASINLRAYPNENAVTTPTEMLRADLFGPAKSDAGAETRRRFGRTLSMDRMETALLSAFRGSMADITDILQETVDTDPHLGAILNKRFGAISALPYEIQPANGVGIDRDKAMFYAEVVRVQLRNLKSFRRNISQLAWALFNGRACLEKNWIQLQPGVALSDPRYGTPFLAVQDLEWIHPRRLTFGRNRELRIQPENAVSVGTFSSSTGLSVLDMPDKFIWWLPQLFNDYPEREGLGIRCMYWSFFKRFAARERMILTELYGKPWRIVTVDPESSAGAPELEAADRIVDSLGSAHTARMPRGVNLNVVAPGKSAGDVHADVIKESDAQNSKLVLGQTGTTDGVPSGLNNSQANVMQDEQLGVLMRDAGIMGELFETMLTDRIIALNFGEGEVTHAPTFRFRADLPADRKAELERLTAALGAGLSIQRTEAYEISGFSVPDPSDVIIRNEQPPTPPNSPVAPAVRPVVVFPPGAAVPEAGLQAPLTPAAPTSSSANAQVGAADASKTITVNEDRAARGLDPLTLPDGSPDPLGDLTIDEYTKAVDAKYAETSAAPAPQDALAIAASRNAKAKVAFDINEFELDTPYGDGGMHLHLVARDRLETEIDGRHMHVFKMGGQYFSSLLDGGHSHLVASADAETTTQGGEHFHSVVLPSGTATTASMDGSAHSHELQVSTTAVDGAHTHLLHMIDPGNPAGYSEVRSMTPGELAVDIALGLVPDTLWQQMDTQASNSLVPLMIAAARTTNRQIEETRSIKLEAAVRTTNGSPDDFAPKAMRELAVETSAWADTFEKAVEGQTSVFGTYNALVIARQNLSIAKFGRVLERGKLQSLMLGVMDSVKELSTISDVADQAEIDQATNGSTELGAALEHVGLSKINLCKIVLAPIPFSKTPFKTAVTTFKELKLLDRASFERASAAIKQRSFTVAGVVGDQMLGVLQSDLFESIKAGEDLKAFRARIRPRLQDSGFVAQLGELKDGQRALNASHIETVFRTNTMNTYNTGRYVHQTSPSVMASFPVWEIQGVNDTRTRETHLATHGVMLMANDPFWQSAYPPFGWNCRCRVVPRTKKYLDSVKSSSTIMGIPDKGFTSGRGALATG